MLSDKQVNHPTYQVGELEPLEERVQKTVSRFLCQALTHPFLGRVYLQKHSKQIIPRGTQVPRGTTLILPACYVSVLHV
jgi:hypothetical protein